MTQYAWYDFAPLALLAAFWLGALAFGVRAAGAPYRRDPAARAGALDLWRRRERLNARGARLRRASLVYLYAGFGLLLLALWLAPRVRR